MPPFGTSFASRTESAGRFPVAFVAGKCVTPRRIGELDFRLLESQVSRPTVSDDTRDHYAALLESVAETRSRAAFSELFNFYAPRLKSYMLRLGADEMLAEELCQEVMITVWRKAE